MTSRYRKNGPMFQVHTDAQLDLRDSLPVGTYTVGQNPMTGEYYLEIVEGFTIEGKIYGDTQKTANRILNTFSERAGSTGVMLSGEKGSGKTLLAKLLSVDAMSQNIPTVIINQPHSGEAFNNFMQSIEQPIVVIFDEFEKVYPKEEQTQLLTLLDGVYPSKKLYVITCNDKYRVNEHMQNRPGRIYYRIEYTGLSVEFIRQYCEDVLINKDHIDSVAKISALFSQFNFDMLKALVEEMNRYNETAQEAMVLLNAKPETGEAATYNVTLENPAKTKSGEAVAPDETWRGNPLSGPVGVEYTHGSGKDSDWDMAVFATSDLRDIDATTGKFTFENAHGEKLSLVKQPVEAPSYYSMAF